jgi:hypothetical protein
MIHRASASEQTTGSYDEAIRTLRNSILLTDFDRRLRSRSGYQRIPAGRQIDHRGAARRGALPASAARTLLIDGDLRRPSVHRKLASASAVGLSDGAGFRTRPGKTSWQPNGEYHPSDVLTAGPISRRSSELLEKRLLQILEEASLVYDLVIFGRPTDARIRRAAAYGDCRRRSVVGGPRRPHFAKSHSVGARRYWRRLRSNVLGLVLNEVNKEMSDSYYYYGHYGQVLPAERVEA